MSNVLKSESEMLDNANAIVERLLKGGANKDKLVSSVDEFMHRTQNVREQLNELVKPLQAGKFGGQGARVTSILTGYVHGLECMVEEAGSATLRAFLYSCPKRADRALGEIDKRLHVMEFIVKKLGEGIA